MKRQMFILMLAVLCLALPVAAEEMTLEQILEKHYKAVGGLETWKAIDSVAATGKMTMGPGMEAPFKMTLKRPMKMRLEFTMQGMTGIQAYDGKTAWMLMPFMGKTVPEEMSADMAKSVIEQADLDGPLVDWKEKGHTVEYVGKEDVEGTPTYKLKVTMASGDVRYHYLDQDAFVVIRQEGATMVQGQELEIVTTIGDYKKVGDIYFPHSIESKPKGAPQGQMITINEVMLDVDVEDNLFSMPEKEAESEAAE